MIRTAHPTGPFLLSLFGGVLILSNGIVLWIAWATALSTTLAPYGNPLESLALLEGFLGIVVILLATALFLDPRHPFGFGVTIIGLSLLSSLGGGGFLLGLALGLIGGIWALWVEPVGPDAPTVRPTTSSIDQVCGRCRKRYSGLATMCPFCGANSERTRGQAT
ncbi:MAG: hypothetical protein ABSA63_08175 [Thermoplasmata archaeon]|jgi:hypothetical protein